MTPADIDSVTSGSNALSIALSADKKIATITVSPEAEQFVDLKTICRPENLESRHSLFAALPQNR